MNDHPLSVLQKKLKICLLPFVLSGLVFSYSTTTNERSSETESGGKSINQGPADIIISFENEEDLEQFSVSRSQHASFEEDPESGSERNVLRVNVPEGSHYGTEMDYFFDGVEEVHMKWEQYIPHNWTTATGTHMKFPGIGNRDKHGWGGRRVDGTGGWSVRTGVRDRPAYNDSLSVEFYVYHMDMGDWGSIYPWEADADGAVIPRGEWAEIENYVRVNTPGKRDGIIRGWVNEKLVFEKTDMRFRADGYEQYDIREIMWHVYHGGAEASPVDQHIYFRNLKIWLGNSFNK